MNRLIRHLPGNPAMARRIRIAVFYFVFVLGGVEALLWLVPAPDPYEHPVLTFNKFLPSYTWHSANGGNLPRSSTFNSKGLTGVSSNEAPYTLNRLGFLYPDEHSKRQSKDEIRIGIIGGSTVECIALREEKRWPNVLQNLLSKKHPGRMVTVLNLGVSGQDSRSHLATTAQLAVKLDLDTLVYLLGINDLFRVREPFDPLADQTAVSSSRTSEPFIRWAATRSQIVRRVGMVKHRIYPAHEDTPPDGPYFAPYAKQRQRLPTLQTDLIQINSDAMLDFEQNMISLNALTNASGAKAVFLTSPALWKENMSRKEDELDWFFVEYHGTQYKLQGRDSMRLLGQLNTQILRTCSRYKLYCFDLASKIPPDLEHFYDGVHFNDNGASKVGTLVEQFLMPIVSQLEH